MSILKNWVWLSLCISYTNISRILDRFHTPENVFIAQESELLRILSRKEVDKILNQDFTEAEEILSRCFDKEITVFSITDSMYPDLLRNIVNPPLVLYMKGRLPDLDTEVGLNIIGTRRASVYGKLVAKTLTFKLAKKGIVVISGMATGIDSIAHSQAIMANKPTVAVLGCSVDYCYPTENRALMDDIIAVGAVISEYPPTTKPYPANFPKRNRIMSGLCRGTLVIEAPKKSGTLITASYALEQGRDIFAIPGNIDNINSEGCNELIKIGAKMVTSAYDILSEYELQLGMDISEPHIKYKINIVASREPAPIEPMKITKKEYKQNPLIESPKKRKKRQDMSEQESIIYDIIGRGADEFDEISQKSEMKASDIMMAMTMLEINGDIEKKDGRIKIKEN